MFVLMPQSYDNILIMQHDCIIFYSLNTACPGKAGSGPVFAGKDAFFLAAGVVVMKQE
ncbi:MAG: hypothetical protein LBL79_13840 [Prevotella sp.]|jgi:hypothetical protein|nr:hypothetical protein [Prevotella sp.]